jgi:hypothetical protein
MAGIVNLKLYFARFIPRTGGAGEFYKFGHTKHYDFMKRFQEEKYKAWYVTPMTSAYGPEKEVLEAEQELLKKYPKNIYIQEKISGVTEIFVPKDQREIQEIFRYFETKRKLWYNLRSLK